MRKDPIVEEVRAIRAAIFKECHYDVHELVAYLQRRSKAEGWKTVTLRPRPVVKPAEHPKARRRRTA